MSKPVHKTKNCARKKTYLRKNRRFIVDVLLLIFDSTQLNCIQSIPYTFLFLKLYFKTLKLSEQYYTEIMNTFEFNKV